MSKKYIRHQPTISRHSEESVDSDHWLKQFESQLQKGAVQSKKVDQSLFDQINSIMNNKSKYPSVEAAVEDMKERSGFTAYLNKLNKLSQEDVEVQKVSTAEDQQQVIDKKVELTPIVIQKVPSIKSTLENYINDTRGNLSIPAILNKIHSIHKSDIPDEKDWEDEKLLMLISQLNLNAKKNNPNNYNNYANLGKQTDDHNTEIDPSNTDVFHALTPVKT